MVIVCFFVCIRECPTDRLDFVFIKILCPLSRHSSIRVGLGRDASFFRPQFANSTRLETRLDALRDGARRRRVDTTRREFGGRRSGRRRYSGTEVYCVDYCGRPSVWKHGGRRDDEEEVDGDAHVAAKSSL